MSRCIAGDILAALPDDSSFCSRHQVQSFLGERLALIASRPSDLPEVVETLAGALLEPERSIGFEVFFTGNGPVAYAGDFSGRDPLRLANRQNKEGLWMHGLAGSVSATTVTEALQQVET